MFEASSTFKWGIILRLSHLKPMKKPEIQMIFIECNFLGHPKTSWELLGSGSPPGPPLGPPWGAGNIIEPFYGRYTRYTRNRPVTPATPVTSPLHP